MGRLASYLEWGFLRVIQFRKMETQLCHYHTEL
jgi:hypothetical protein